MGATKEKLLRTLDILKTTDEQHPLTTAKIIALLRDYGLEPERKSVLRDIAVLQDYGYDIEKSADNKEGFYLGERDFEDWELKVLIDAVQSAKFLNQSDTDRLVDKLCSLASEDTEKTLKFMLIPEHSKAGEKSVKNSIDTIMHAIRSRSKVQFDYVYTDDCGKTVSKHPEGTKPVSPYALIWRKDKYYLIGSYSEKEGLSYYRLDRIRRAEELSEEKAVPLQDILGSDYSRKLRSFAKQNIYNRKGDAVRLKLALSYNGRDEIFDSFGDDVTIIQNTDGTVDAYVTVSDSEGLYDWLMKHGRYFTVLEPTSVRENLVERLKNMLGNYDIPSI